MAADAVKCNSNINSNNIKQEGHEKLFGSMGNCVSSGKKKVNRKLSPSFDYRDAGLVTCKHSTLGLGLGQNTSSTGIKSSGNSSLGLGQNTGLIRKPPPTSSSTATAVTGYESSNKGKTTTDLGFHTHSSSGASPSVGYIAGKQVVKHVAQRSSSAGRCRPTSVSGWGSSRPGQTPGSSPMPVSNRSSSTGRVRNPYPRPASSASNTPDHSHNNGVYRIGCGTDNINRSRRFPTATSPYTNQFKTNMYQYQHTPAKLHHLGTLPIRSTSRTSCADMMSRRGRAYPNSTPNSARGVPSLNFHDMMKKHVPPMARSFSAAPSPRINPNPNANSAIRRSEPNIAPIFNNKARSPSPLTSAPQACKDCKVPAGPVETVCFISNDGKVTATNVAASSLHLHHCNSPRCAANPNYNPASHTPNPKKVLVSRNRSPLPPSTKPKSKASEVKAISQMQPSDDNVGESSTVDVHRSDADNIEIRRSNADTTDIHRSGTEIIDIRQSDADIIDIRRSDSEGRQSDMDIKDIVGVLACATEDVHSPRQSLDSKKPSSYGDDTIINASELKAEDVFLSASSLFTQGAGGLQSCRASYDSEEALSDLGISSHVTACGQISEGGMCPQNDEDNEDGDHNTKTSDNKNDDGKDSYYSCSEDESNSDAATIPITSVPGQSLSSETDIQKLHLHSVAGMENMRKKFLSALSEQEAETVRLRKQEAIARKQAGDWMLDCAMEEMLHKLAPSGETRVKVIVEAFETIMQHVDVEIANQIPNQSNTDVSSDC